MKPSIRYVVLFSVVFALTVAAQYWLQNKQQDLQMITIQVNDCQLQQNPCQVQAGEVAFDISAPQNIFYLEPFVVQLRLQNDSAAPRSIEADFTMQNMQMGLNRFKFQPEANAKRWSAKAVLPVCVTGRADWQMELRVVSDGAQYRLLFPIEVRNKNALSH